MVARLVHEIGTPGKHGAHRENEQPRRRQREIAVEPLELFRKHRGAQQHAHAHDEQDFQQNTFRIAFETESDILHALKLAFRVNMFHYIELSFVLRYNTDIAFRPSIRKTP